jgi:hypothetical protein
VHHNREDRPPLSFSHSHHPRTSFLDPPLGSFVYGAARSAHPQAEPESACSEELRFHLLRAIIEVLWAEVQVRHSPPPPLLLLHTHFHSPLQRLHSAPVQCHHHYGTIVSLKVMNARVALTEAPSL